MQVLVPLYVTRDEMMMMMIRVNEDSPVGFIECSTTRTNDKQLIEKEKKEKRVKRRNKNDNLS
jgi:hypothetical protein